LPVDNHNPLDEQWLTSVATDRAVLAVHDHLVSRPGSSFVDVCAEFPLLETQMLWDCLQRLRRLGLVEGPGLDLSCGGVPAPGRTEQPVGLLSSHTPERTAPPPQWLPLFPVTGSLPNLVSTEGLTQRH